MIKNLFGRGVGFGAAHWVVTRGFGPEIPVTPQKTGSGSKARSYRQPQQNVRMPINRLLSALPARLSIRGGMVEFVLTRAPIIDPFAQARQEDELWLLCDMDANEVLLSEAN